MKKSLKKSICLVGTAVMLASAVAPIANVLPFGANASDAVAYAGTQPEMVAIDSINFPDVNFRNALIGLFGSSTVPKTTIETTTELLLADKNISDLTGIQYFIGLKKLNVATNNLKNLDLRANSQLNDLYISNNKITNLILPVGATITPKYFAGQRVNTTTSYVGDSWTVDLKALGFADMTKIRFDNAGWTLDAVNGIAKYKGVSNAAPQDMYVTVDLGNGYSLNVNIVLATSNIAVTSVAIDPAEVSVNVGKTAQLKAVFTPENASNKSLTWSIDRSDIATIDEKGVVTGKKIGTANVTVRTTDGNKIGTCKVTVTEITGVEVTPSESFVAPGATVQLSATVSPATAANKAVTWSSSDESIAKVDANGLVTGVKLGKVTITATATDGKIKGTAIVNVTDVKGITVTPEKATIAKGKTTQLTAKLNPENVTDKKIQWRSSDTNIATVDGNGLVTGIKAGKALITAFTEDGYKSASSIITVVDNTSVTLSYEAHVQTYGWMTPVAENKIAGTTGLAKRMEALKLSLSEFAEGGIEYKAHVQTYGWMDWKANGAIAGTTGQAKRMEAVQIRLTGEIAKEYDVYYRVHVQKKGWLNWVSNGTTAGTTGEARRMEAIQIQLVKKGDPAPK